jgi:Pyruvate phosphate dikinase, AMP/ATP-binding domain
MYRIDNNFDHFKVALSIGVQKMNRSDLATSAEIFTLDTETGFRDFIFITACYGLGENIIQSSFTPDEYYVFKPTFRMLKSQKDTYQACLLIVLLIAALWLLYDRSRYTHQTDGAELPRNSGWQAPSRAGR